MSVGSHIGSRRGPTRGIASEQVRLRKRSGEHRTTGCANVGREDCVSPKPRRLTRRAMVMNPRIDYTQVAARLNYAALEKKLEQMGTQAPPKKRRHIGDVLAPVAEKLRELRAKGWTYDQLARELTDAGLPMKPSALRDHLTAKKPRAARRSRPRGAIVAQKQ